MGPRCAKVEKESKMVGAKTKMTFQPNYHNNQLVASPNVMVGLYCHLNDRSTGLSSLSLVLGSMHVVTRNLLQVFFWLLQVF